MNVLTPENLTRLQSGEKSDPSIIRLAAECWGEIGPGFTRNAPGEPNIREDIRDAARLLLASHCRANDISTTYQTRAVTHRGPTDTKSLRADVTYQWLIVDAMTDWKHDVKCPQATRRAIVERVLRALGQAQPTTDAPDPSAYRGLQLIPGGFAYNGIAHTLTGKPRDMLAELLRNRWRRANVEDLVTLLVEPDNVEHERQAIMDAASELRQSLRAAIKAAGIEHDNPLLGVGRGKDLNYKLEMPTT